MARKNHNPGCPCCDADFPCEPTDCPDETTKNIKRVTLELVMPDDIVLISQAGGFGFLRRLARFSGWESINGTYTFELNEVTCKWESFQFPDTSDIYVESWELPNDTNCSNIDTKIAAEIALGRSPYYEGFMPSDCVNLIMFTFDITTKFKHEFQIFINEDLACGGVIAINLGPSSEPGNVCGESAIVYKDVSNMQRIPGGANGLVGFDCGDVSLITGTANSYET